MKVNLHCRHYGFTLGAALALGTTVAFALTPTPDGYADERPIMLAQAAPTPAVVPAGDPAAGYPAVQAGVRRAAAEGPDALRRYVWRTRMIYNFYIVDFMILA
jgi:hypothetical protein